MPPITNLGLLLAIFCCNYYLCSKLFRQKSVCSLIAAVLSLGWAFLPLHAQGVTATGFVYAVSSNLSITTTLLLLLLVLYLVTKVQVLHTTNLLHLALSIVALGVFLYPGELGFVASDPYRLGFYPSAFGYLMLAVILVVCLAGSWQVGLLFCIAWVAGLALRDSPLAGYAVNLWDYLLDLWLFVWAFGYCLRRFFVTLAARC